MRIDDLLNDMTQKANEPDNLPDLYELEDNPDSEMHKDLQNLYNPKKIVS